MKRISIYLSLLFALLISFGFMACGNKSKFVFANTEEAVDACRSMLTELRKTEDADIKKLTAFVSDWKVLQDTVMNKLTTGDVAETTKDVAENFFITADSIKIEIKRIAHARKRSLNDVLYLKLNASMDMETWVDKKTLKDAQDFFEKLDDNKTYPTLKQTIEAYYELLNNSGKLAKEGELLTFIKNEDVCFRSLMNHILQVNQNDLKQLSDMTAQYYDALTESVTKNLNDETCKRISLYLTMRLNRRVVQNAEACRLELQKKPKLTELQSQNFKWMLVQPFFSLDDFSSALVTKDQKDKLEKLAADLPDMMTFIDGINVAKGKKDNREELYDTLNEYFLNSFLNFNI